MSAGCRPIILSGWVTGVLLVIGLIVLWLNPAGDFWKSVEMPKAQLEACDPTKLTASVAPTPAIYREAALNRLVREPVVR